jgi:transposase
MSRVMEVGMEDVEGQGRSSARSDEPEVRSEVRWSARRKEGVVMRLLRGESLDLLSRETGQPAGRISGWREEFLAAGREGLKSRPVAVEDVALRAAQRKVGELSMEVDILRALLERKGLPQSPRRSR